MKNSTFKVQPADVRGYSVCPAVKNLNKKVGWQYFSTAAYVLAVEGLTNEGTRTIRFESIREALSDVFPTVGRRSMNVMLEKALQAGTIRPAGTSPDGSAQFYALTAYGAEIAEQVREAAREFAVWEQKLPGGRFEPHRKTKMKEQIATLTKENEKAHRRNSALTLKVAKLETRIAELEADLATLSRRP